MASEKVLQQKKEEVSKLAEEMKEAKLILLTNYRGINVADDTSLRRDLRNVNAKYTIIKNNITRRALAEAGIEGLEDKLVGPTAVILCNEDYLEPSKTVYEFSKDNDYYEIKGGVVDGKVMYKNLKTIGKDYNWLKKQVNKFNMEPEEALIVTFDGGSQMFCQKKLEK